MLEMGVVKGIERNKETSTLKKPFVVIDKFLPLYVSKAELNLLYGGGSSGKSKAGLQLFVYKGMTMEGRRMFVFRKYRALHKDSCWNDTLSIISDLGLDNRVKINQSELSITFLDTGSVILFRGLDDPSKMKSVSEATDYLFEEADEISEYAFDQMTFRLRGGVENMQIILCYNPPSTSHWLYRRFHSEEAEIDEEDTLIIHSTAWDNGFNTPNTLKALKKLKKTNYDFYVVYALGQFGDGGANVFTKGEDFEVKDFDINEIYNTRKKTNKLFIKHGADTGYNDPTTFNSYLFDVSTKEIYIYKEVNQSKTATDDIEKMVLEHGYANKEVHIDGQNKPLVEGLKKKFPKFKSAKKYQILERIAFLKNFKIYIHPSCEKTLEEFENYSFTMNKETGRVDKDKNPKDNYNHHIDNMGYAAADIIRLFTEDVATGKRRSSFRKPTKINRSFYNI